VLQVFKTNTGRTGRQGTTLGSNNVLDPRASQLGDNFPLNFCQNPQLLQMGKVDYQHVYSFVYLSSGLTHSDEQQLDICISAFVSRQQQENFSEKFILGSNVKKGHPQRANSSQKSTIILMLTIK
jgi:hypothetical protein